jgi:hypothetical protein
MFPQATTNFFSNRLLTKLSILLVLTVSLTVAASAQKSIFTKSVLLPNPAADMDHCANGPITAPEVCSNADAAGTNWGNGNLNSSGAHYREGESVPYRAVFTDLEPSSQYTITIAYDVAKDTKYAFDYWTTYDRTENGSFPSAGQANACGDVIAGCDPNAPTDFTPILDDPLINPPTGQIAGQVEIWGASFSGAEFEYTPAMVGDPDLGTATRFVRLTFTTDADGGTVVIAWAGHIATRADWGDNRSAIAINGSPYHMNFETFTGPGGVIGVGAQDHQLSVDAIYFPNTITIVKLVVRPGNPPTYSAPGVFFPFDVNILGTNPNTDFSLEDADPSQTAGGSTSFQSIAFSTNTAVTVKETQVSPFDLTNITCSVTPGGNTNIGSTSVNLLTLTATLNLLEGNNATCTFTNSDTRTTAAPASISGRVSDPYGYGLAFARVVVQNASTGETRTATTNNFGYYTVADLGVGEFYQINVVHKRYSFASQFVSLQDNISDMDFMAVPE